MKLSFSCRLRTTVFAAFALFAAIGIVRADSPAARELEKSYQSILPARDPAHPKHRPVATRAVMHLIIEAAAQQPEPWRPDRIEELLAFARSFQDLDLKSKTCGNFRWNSSDATPTDLNAVEFYNQMMGYLHKQHAPSLTPAARATLEQMMRDSVPALLAHKVAPSYTNIFIMKAWSLIAIGESLRLPETADAGYRLFDDWLAYTAENGITEFLAVNYYGVDLDSLNLIAKYADRPAARAKARDAARYLWTDAAANFRDSTQRLASANSRSYDYLYAHGNFDNHLYPAKWLTTNPRKRPTQLTAFRTACTFNPPEEWTQKIRATLPRTVVQRWGENLENTATHHQTAHYSIASSATGRGSDARALVIDLAQTPATPQITLFMDGRNDPYGTKKTKHTATAHAKALHLTPLIATVQNTNEILTLLHFDPANKKHLSRDRPSCLLTQIPVPAAATIILNNNQQLAPGTPENPTKIPLTDTIAIRLNNATVALRILYATKTPDKLPPEIHYICDNEKNPANRLTIVHGQSTPKTPTTLALWFRATDIPDEKSLSSFLKKFSRAKYVCTKGTLFGIRAHGERGILRADLDLPENKILRLEGGNARPQLLSLNGEEIGLPILQKYRRAEISDSR